MKDDTFLLSAYKYVVYNANFALVIWFKISLSVTRTSKGPRKIIRLNECAS